MEIPVFNANIVDLDQMPHSAASDLGLHCLPMSLLWDTRYKWVKKKILKNLTELKKMKTTAKSESPIRWGGCTIPWESLLHEP